MPVFPNINTLVNKSTLTGDEVIQISATEKTTLNQIVQQLGFTPSSVLTGLTDGTPGTISTPQATDTLNQALSKLVALVGGKKLLILPTTATGSYDEDAGIRLVVAVDNSVVSGGTGGTVALIYIVQSNGQPRITVNYKSWSSDLDNPLNTCDTVQELAAWIGGDGGDGNIYNWGESFKENSSTTVGFNPGDVIFHTGNDITSIVIPIYYWNQPKTMFSQNSAMIITKVNVLKSMFNQGSGGSFGNIVYLFSEDFDDAPGTEYQCITIQKVRSSGGKAYLMVNKGGYIANT